MRRGQHFLMSVNHFLLIMTSQLTIKLHFLWSLPYFLRFSVFIYIFQTIFSTFFQPNRLFKCISKFWKENWTYDVIMPCARGEKRWILTFFNDIHLCEVILSNFLDEIVSLNNFLNFSKKNCVYDVIIPGSRVMFRV